MKQKHYMDIEHIRSASDFIKSNTKGFNIGDKITITEKLDGANASFRYDEETGKLCCFSRKQELNEMNTLRGFWNWTQELDTYPFRTKEWGNYVYFGEWLCPHTVKYNKEAYSDFYMFDVYDTVNQYYLPSYVVKEMAQAIGVKTVPYLYEGPFVSWEHCYQFMNQPSYGDTQEGIVVRNEQRRNDNRLPKVLKIVNSDFKETMGIKRKTDDPEKVAARNAARELAETVVTPARVRKMIHKLIDEGVLPVELTPQDMGAIAKVLPKRIYEDVMKEEADIVKEMKEYGGKMIAGETMQLAREIILGA